MTTKYKLPSVKKILELAATEEGRDNIISDFRTKTDNLSIEEALIVKERLDAEVAALVNRLEEAIDVSREQDDYQLSDTLYDLKMSVVYAYGYDGYDGGVWIDSGY